MGLPAVVEDSGLGFDGVQLGQAITLLSAQINVANHRLLRMIAEFDRCGGWREGGTMRTCAHWLAAHCGLALGAAREKLRVARQLCGLPEVDQAFSGGELSYSKVRAITRVATPDNEGFMVHLAEQNSAGHLEKLVARYQPVPEPGLDGLLDGLLCQPADGAAARGNAGEADVEPAPDAEALREQNRELYWFQDENGMWVVHARLPPEQGQLVIKALQAVTRPLEEERQEEWQAKQKARRQEVARKILQRGSDGRDGRDGREEDVSAETLAARVCARHEQGAAVGAPGIEGSGVEESGAGVEKPVFCRSSSASADHPAGSLPDHLAFERAEEKISAETFSQHMNQTRADALVAMVEHFLASGPDYRGLQGLKGSERCQVVMHIDVNTLREQRSGVCCTHGKAHFEDKPWLSPATARRLSCDASLVTVLEDDAGKVLNVGRRSRIVPSHIRRALRERDGVCQYPGCQESEYVDAHHIHHWADGGETRLDNLVTLCRFHHRQLHRACFDIRLNGVSAEIFYTDQGRAVNDGDDKHVL